MNKLFVRTYIIYYRAFFNPTSIDMKEHLDTWVKIWNLQCTEIQAKGVIRASRWFTIQMSFAIPPVFACKRSIPQKTNRTRLTKEILYIKWSEGSTQHNSKKKRFFALPPSIHTNMAPDDCFTRHRSWIPTPHAAFTFGLGERDQNDPGCYSSIAFVLKGLDNQLEQEQLECTWGLVGRVRGGLFRWNWKYPDSSLKCELLVRKGSNSKAKKRLNRILCQKVLEWNGLLLVERSFPRGSSSKENPKIISTQFILWLIGYSYKTPTTHPHAQDTHGRGFCFAWVEMDGFLLVPTLRKNQKPFGMNNTTPWPFTSFEGKRLLPTSILRDKWTKNVFSFQDDWTECMWL